MKTPSTQPSLTFITHRLRWLTLVVAFAFCVSLPNMMANRMSAQGPNVNQPAQANAPGPQAAKARTAADDSFLEIVFSGGIMGIGIMSLLILLSIISVYLVIEQTLSLRKKDLIPPELLENVRLLVAQGKLKDADQACRERPCLLSFILVSGISEIEFGWSAVEKAIEDSTGDQAARLYRRLEYLSVIANIAPMLGLLGTVTGMILAFRQVAISQGNAGAGDLAGGIYSALVTTVAGLMIAIPALGAFALFRNRIDAIITEAAYSAQHVFATVRRRMPGSAPARPAVPQPPRTS